MNAINLKKSVSKTKKHPFMVKVLAYKNKLVLTPSCHEVREEWVPCGGNYLGSVILNSKQHLQVSQKALDLMSKIRRSNDDIGDIGWWKCTNGNFAFSWLGAIYRIIDPKTAEGDRNFAIHQDACTIIPNRIPQEVIDGFNNKDINPKRKEYMWKMPYSTTFDGDE
jgi:hypothetical protein